MEKNEMTTLKLLSAALVATAMVATPAMARQNHAAVRHTNATTATGASDAVGGYCAPAPAVGAFATQPWDNGPPPGQPTY